MTQCGLGAWIDALQIVPSIAGCQDHTRAFSGRHEGVRGHRRAMHEVPRPQLTFLIFDYRADTRPSGSGSPPELTLRGRGRTGRPGGTTRIVNPALGFTYSVRSGRPRSTKSSDSKMQTPPLHSSFVTQAASAVLTTNQPGVTGASPEPTLSSRASVHVPSCVVDRTTLARRRASTAARGHLLRIEMGQLRRIRHNPESTPPPR